MQQWAILSQAGFKEIVAYKNNNCLQKGTKI
jgi:hypothetical protein